MRFGKLLTVFPHLSNPIDGTWVILNTTEASQETIEQFSHLRASLGPDNTDARRAKLFTNLLEAAYGTKAASPKQATVEELIPEATVWVAPKDQSG